jgi:hypothetical protein
MSKYNANLASEFHVLSMLHRLGMDANLTLGNKKTVDIIVSNEDGKLVTIDVEGIAGKYDWPADNIREPKSRNHFVVLVSYEGRIEDPTFMPKVWVLPHKAIPKFIKQYRKRKDVSRSRVQKDGEEFLNAWELISTYLGT